MTNRPPSLARHTQRAARLVLVLGVAGVAACSALLDLEEVEYRARPDEVDGAADGTTAPTEVEAPDTPITDGGAAEASDLDDAGGTVTVCANLPPGTRFCRHFDNDKPLESGFTSTRVIGGRLAIDDLDAFSKPRSLVAQTTADGGCAYLTRADSKSFDKVTMSFRARLSAATSGTIARVIIGSCDFGLTTTAAYQRAANTATVAASQRLGTEVPRDTWVKVRFEVSEEDARRPRVRVALDDVQVLDAVLNADPCPFVDGEPTFNLGLLCGAAGREIRYDDVILGE